MENIQILSQPDDIDALMWRYMDFTKFVSMLENQGFYMCRLDKLGDPFEGTITEAILNTKFVDENGEEVKEFAHKDKIIDMRRQMARNFRQWHTANCWHMNTGESAAMWSMYSKTNEAICIQSNFRALIDNIESESLVIGCVRYIDYGIDTIPWGNVFWPALHKRKSFDHEKEVRLLDSRLEALEPELFNQFEDGFIPGEQAPMSTGYFIGVPLGKIITNVLVHPEAPQWFFDLVGTICNRYKLEVDPIQSELSSAPFL